MDAQIEQPSNYVDLVADAVWGRPAPRDEQGRFAPKEPKAEPIAEEPVEPAKEVKAEEQPEETQGAGITA